MSIRKLSDAALISFVVGATLYLGFVLMELTVPLIFEFMSP